MITQAFVNAAKLAFVRGVHQPSDVYKLALYGPEASLGKTTAVYTPAGEVDESGDYTAGGRVLTGYRALIAGDAAVLSWDDPTWTRATIAAEGGLIYNATRGNAALAVLNFGELVVSTRGVFSVALPTATEATGLIRIT